ncbi:MAG: hypothetical protein EAZ13_09800 [Sphingobacteriia bacterium]|nr:MAG: hypothetical protein EAZ41_03675 [Sphingobacteriia bacterium]TAG29811.1 MAG: hypothetical protein EAZ35_09300 [Sphingobacteriia bacterium]TAH06328.1 MAG: hypothetical protein EAZ13_09800 [Sphingobacteriia bacterium]
MPSKEENVYITIIIASIFLLMISVFLIILLFVYMRKQRINNQERLELKNHYEQTLLKTELEIQEQTLNYIGNEIHSNIVQVLYFARLQISQLPDIVTHTHRAELYDLLKKVSDDLREISHSLNENRFNQIGLYESIKQLLYNIERTGKYAIELVVADEIDMDNLPVQSDLILFRMIQEIIHNILKHAAASFIKISVSLQNNTTVIEISDNGIGFDLSLIKNQNKGIGLSNIMARAKFIHATVTINSIPSSGTLVTITINS